MTAPLRRRTGRALSPKVAILTAGMGAGHDKVAQEISRRLAERGVDAELIDVWDLLPLGIGRLIMGFYKVVVRRVPWLYELIYAIWLRPSDKPGRRASPLIKLAAQRFERWMATHQPSAALSTFHLCSQVLGDMRRRGIMPIPTASIVVDFAAHGLWVDPDVDLHICLHQRQAERVSALGAPRVESPGPVVAPRFAHPAKTRAEARAALGLDSADKVALIVSGSWGAGNIERTARIVSGCDGWTAVVVTGRNEDLRRRLERIPGVQVHGWVDRMDEFMLAADVVVENAGGLMAMEAMSLGTPVVSFAPIPGHGKENVARMDETGVSRLARDERELVEILGRVASDEPFRRRLVSTAARMFRRDAADVVATMARMGADGDPGYASA